MATTISSNTSTDEQTQRLHHWLAYGAELCAKLVERAVKSAFNEDVTDMHAEIVQKMAKPTIKARGELTLPCFVFAKRIKGAPPATAATIQQSIAQLLVNANSASSPADDTAADVDLCYFDKTEQQGPYINFFMSPRFLTVVIPHTLSGAFCIPLPPTQPKVMVEYSQPNTHKAFHVGHMRNAALGDCLVRLYEQVGHPVVAANYFGDEGAHVAKCLWWLRRYMAANPSFELDSVPEAERGEWLGGFYSKAVEMLDLSSLTSMPYAYVVCAKVLSIEQHPAADAPTNWRVVRLQHTADESQSVTVVCGGMGYQVGDRVAYLPVGGKLQNKVVEPKDMKGVLSHGVMMAEKELGIERKPVAAADAAADASSAAPKKDDKAGGKGKGGKGGKAADAAKDPATAAATAATTATGNVSDAANNQIYILDASVPIGAELCEHGRLADALPADVKVIDEYNTRKQEARDTLKRMEHGDAELCALWEKTKQWSLDEFKRIYKWLGCRFDHDFFESEVSESSRLIAQDYYAKGVLINSNGAIGADLSAYGLGFCMVLKSDGAGLYATKDLSLARRKFDMFKIDKSIYVVDAAQTLHFKQVFKTLELMGYEQAKNCVHIPYGQVVLPSGKMSSRTGTVILFSQLREQLDQDIYKNFLSKYAAGVASSTSASTSASTDATTPATSTTPGTYVKIERNVEQWTAEEIAHARQVIAVATIKYGMLNHDTAKDIVFVLSEWTAQSGNTGPYMLYAYARIRSIVREVAQTSSLSKSEIDALVDYSLLTHDLERAALTNMHEFWIVIEQCVHRNNPSSLCDYLFDLSKSFSAWYDKCSIIKAETEALKWTRLRFIEAIGEVIKCGLGLLGVPTLDRM